MTIPDGSMVKRGLRLSIPADMFTEIEHLAKTTNMTVARAAVFVLAFGLVAVNGITDPNPQHEPSPGAP